MTYKKVSIIAIGLNFVVMNGQPQSTNQYSASWRLTDKRRGGVVDYFSLENGTSYFPCLNTTAAISSKRSLFSVPKV